MSLFEAASFLSQQWPVFVCNGDKRPLTAHGLKDATTDIASIRDMFHRPGAAMIGVPTGEASGFVVVDLDIKEGASGLEWLAANEHRLPRTRRHRTRSGGLHLLFITPAGRTIRNSASKIAPGVDIRGQGGYVIVPPSPGYSIADDAMPAEMPGWLLEVLDPAAPVQPEPVRQVVRRDDDTNGSRYGLRALEDECTAVMNAPFGQQEVTLNNAGLKIGALVAGGELAHGYALAMLHSAARGMPSQGGKPAWGSEELHRKVERAFADGAARPRQAPPREVRHTVRVEMVIPPEPPPYDEPPEHWASDVAFDPETGEILDAPRPVAPKPTPSLKAIPFFTFSDAAPNLDCADFVEDFLTEGAMSVLYGESNSGKTFFATDLAFHVAAGRMWRDRAVEQGAVVYLALEGRHGISNRLAAIKAEFGMEDAQLPIAIIAVSLNLLNPEADTASLIETIGIVAKRFEIPVKLVIADTLARAISGGNENSPEDMGQLVINGDAIRQETGAHLMWIHHSGKDQAKGARGHSSLRAATETEIEVTNVEGQRMASVTKQREMQGGDTFPFGLRIVELGKNRRGKAVTSCVVEVGDSNAPGGASSKPRLKGHKQRALEVLNDLIATSGQAGHSGVPSGIPSVPDKWWRERFYERAMPGSEAGTRKTAFLRASSELLNEHRVGMDQGRVWVV